MSPHVSASERYSLRLLLREGRTDRRRSSFVVLEVQPFYGKADHFAQNFRCTSGHRHRKRAAVQRNPGTQRGIARGAGASDGNSRGARHHQPLADGRAAGARRDRRERARVCGIDDVVLRLREGERYGSTGSFWSDTACGRVEISIDEPRVSLDARAWHAPRSRRPRAERFPIAEFRRRLAHLTWPLPFVSRGTHWNA